MRTVQVRIATERRIISARTRERQPLFELVHRAVIGIQVDGQPPVKLPRHLRSGENSRVDTFIMPYDFAMRLAAFFKRHYVDGVRGFDCFSFMNYVTGMQRKSIMTWGHSQWGNTVQSGRLRAFRPYGMRQSNTKITEELHFVVAFTPTISLNVLALNHSLLFAATADLMTLYESDTIFEVVGFTESEPDTETLG